jgi:hypothetical protein
LRLVVDRLGDSERAFNEARDTFFLASADESGLRRIRCCASFRRRNSSRALP